MKHKKTVNKLGIVNTDEKRVKGVVLDFPTGQATISKGGSFLFEKLLTHFIRSVVISLFSATLKHKCNVLSLLHNTINNKIM